MELKHHFSVPSTLEETWHSFNQLEEIAPCFPGAVLTGVDGDTFTGTVKVKLGPIAMMYAGTGEFLSRDEATHTVVIQAQGKDKRGNGTAGATVTAVLAADGEGTTVDVTTDMNVTGKPAQFGRGVIQDISDKLLETFVQCVISRAVAQETEAPETEAPPIGTPPAEAVESEPVEAGPVEAEPVEAGHAESPVAGGSAVDPAVEPGPAETVPAPVPPAPVPPAPKPAAKHLPPAAPEVAELDLGSAVWPVLAKRFGPAALLALVALVVVVSLCRRKRRH